MGERADYNLDIDLIDEAVLHQLKMDLGSESYKALFQKLLDSLKSRVSDLSNAFDQKNNKEIFRHSHTLTTSAATLGARPLSKIALEIEQLCKANSYDEVFRRESQIKSIAHETINALNTL